ncbi:MAG: HAMP domain-containing histidine kinase [Acidobacteria bacterium]|nr:HAMP domain-containing histidine kinase [Acidobacteriota bacterium]
MAHDFGNLIETISAAAAVVENACAPASPYRGALEAALAQGETLVSVLQNFALFGEETLTVEPLDLGAVVREVVNATLLPLRAPHVQVQLCTEELPAISSDRVLLSRCLNNLIWNAVQAMPSAGILSLVSCAKNDRVILEVSDTGPGIPGEVQEKIFDASYSTKIGHPGLGLSIVRSLLRRAGGEISMVSQPDFGTTFRLTFPVARKIPSPAQTWARGRRTVPTH